jgi:hypothetical protein
MQSLENRDFENKWRDAFADAEDEPNEALWLSIENSLAATDGIVMRGRVVFYQRLAAASILIALLLGGIAVIKWNSGLEKSQLATSKQNENPRSDAQKQKSAGNQSNNSIANNTINDKAGNSTTNKLKVQNPLASRQPDNNTQATPIQVMENGVNDKAERVQPLSDPKNSKEYSDREITLNNVFAYYDIKLKGKPVFDHRTSNKLVWSEPIVPAKERKEEKDNWWAAIGGSAGAYTQQSTVNGAAFNNLNSPTVASRSQSSTGSNVGSSFSFGMTMGKKISKRWMIMTGVNYLTQSVGYSSNQSLNGNQTYLADLSSQKNVSGAANFTSSYNLNSVNEFVSIPLQAGYQLVQRKFGLQINTGVASDIFLRNTLVDPSGKLSTYTEIAGESSAYQNINWTGLLGTELSYKISSHYRFSLVPGMRYSFQSIVKPSVGSSINPLVWDIGFRLRYNFK